MLSEGGEEAPRWGVGAGSGAPRAEGPEDQRDSEGDCQGWWAETAALGLDVAGAVLPAGRHGAGLEQEGGVGHVGFLLGGLREPQGRGQCSGRWPRGGGRGQRPHWVSPCTIPARAARACVTPVLSPRGADFEKQEVAASKNISPVSLPPSDLWNGTASVAWGCPHMLCPHVSRGRGGLG